MSASHCSWLRILSSMDPTSASHYSLDHMFFSMDPTFRHYYIWKRILLPKGPIFRRRCISFRTHSSKRSISDHLSTLIRIFYPMGPRRNHQDTRVSLVRSQSLNRA